MNVWFHITLFWCRRGREGQRNLKRESFQFHADENTRAYVTMGHDEATKNHPGGFNEAESFEKFGRMYQTDDPNDGYGALRLYLSKLNPKCEAFFQFPKRNWSGPADEVWYENRCLGVNKLANMMKELSVSANLSKIYTNHCVRATAITLWSNAGLSNRHIMAISGHRNEQSLASYNSRPSSNQLQQCSNVLAQALNPSQTAGQVREETRQIQSSTLQPATVSHTVLSRQERCNFAAMFSGCSIGSVNVSFSKSDDH